MNTTEQKKYPIGIQTFSKIREGNYLYIDKTELIYRIVHSDSNYMFLSRPRRFGKSLLISTLQCYFEGRRELFDGLAIDRLETEWTAYPVLRFDMSLGKWMDQERLNRYLHDCLNDNETRLGIHSDYHPEDTNIRLKNLIQQAYRKYNRQVVVLIDEYDAPLLDVVHEEPVEGVRPLFAFRVPDGHHQVLAAEHLQRAEQYIKHQHAAGIRRDLRHHPRRDMYANGHGP